ncbi:SubName: Full=Related to NPY1-NADH pyrophosphatase I of the Nudix family of hydrolases, has a peroxisomal targetin {ECO:0000313/EMBL:CCA69135.1} [Serendipita indica DSM 11827]|nr:SubName: Full=Related to NPY1-NADH pyrophosphatase I of the Nudix family of hydrolases, has a peroxisomal targetin {ECO:0000313/EMBL:CCA69135.1} [Serendipita indica DSM 11827]
MSDDLNAINFMTGSPLNRFGWLRTSARFINASASSSRARWLLFRSGDPLIVKSSGAPLALSTNRVERLLGPQPFFGQGQVDGELASPDIKSLQSARLRGPIAIFLGVLETKNAANTSVTEQDQDVIIDEVKGDAYFALDVTNIDKEVLSVLQDDVGEDAAFASARGAASAFDKTQAAMFAGARAMLEWNSRNKAILRRMWITCVFDLGWMETCVLELASLGGTSFPTVSDEHPRTDAVVITGVIDQTGDKILLGNNKKFPGVFYSTLAGFIEPGEKSGVKVYDVVYHSTQPWPYPSNLMVGFYARADSNQPIVLDLDTELADARWFTREEVLEVLAHPDGTNLGARDYRKLDNIVSGQTTDPSASQAATAPPQEKPSAPGPKFRVPPPTSIAGTLIATWAYGKAKL